MSIGNTDFNSYGVGGGPFGGFGGWGGGFNGGLGGLGLVGLIGLNNLFDRDHGHGHGHGFGGPSIAAIPVPGCGCNSGHGHGGHGEAFDATILSKLGNIEGQVATAACNTDAGVSAAASSIRDSIQNQNLFLQGQLSTLLLAGQQSAANTKDAIQNSLAVLTAQNCDLGSSLQAGICAIKDAVNNDGDATRALINQIERDRLQHELCELKATSRSRDTEINVTQSVNQIQAQQQQQQQFSNIMGLFHNLLGELQIQKQGNRTVQFGAGNVATPTNTANQVGG